MNNLKPHFDLRRLVLLFVAVFSLSLITTKLYPYLLKNFNGPSNKQFELTALLNRVTKVCGEEPDRTKSILCFKKNLETPVKVYSLKPLLAAFEDSFLSDDKSESGGITRCHDVLHAIGQVAGANATDLNETILSCNSLCTFGCYHGVIEGYIAKGGDLIGDLPTLCSPKGPVTLTPASEGACFHGLGHGVADIAGFELKKSLELCNLIKDRDSKRNCGFGVFMELYEPSNFEHPLLEFPEDIPKFCRELQDAYAEVCYDTAGIHEYGRSQDVTRAIKTCNALPTQFQNYCISGLGQNMYFVFQGETAKVLDFCQKVKANQKQACLEGALESSVMSDPLVRHGFKLCEIVDNELKGQCYKVLKQKIEYTHGTKQLEVICDSLSQKEKELCL